MLLQKLFRVLSRPIASPLLGLVDTDGFSAAEGALRSGLRRILGRPDLHIAVTAVRVPVFFGLGVAATIETVSPLGIGEAETILREAPGLLVGRGDEPYATPREVVGTDTVHVGRIRRDPERPTTLSLWAAIDNARKGAALNAVGIAERMLRSPG